MESKFILIIGNINVPDISIKIPLLFKEYFVPGKIDYVFCVGNVGDQKHLNLL